MQAAIRRTRFRVLIALTAVAVPLVAANAAQAAMAGANPATTMLRPDLRSAQITNFNSSTGATTIQVCFDKQIGSTPDASEFLAGNYRLDEVTGDSATRDANGSCANVVWSSTFIDPQQRTYVTADFGAVVNAANGLENWEDSVALKGSNSHNGTRGHAAAPDLEGVTINTATNTINYTMDQIVGGTDGTGCFYAVRQDGTQVEANSGGPFTPDVSFSGNVISVTYGEKLQPNPGIPVVQASIRTDCAFAADATTSIANFEGMTTTAPGTGGFSDNPDLTAITVSDDGRTADYTFDTAVKLVGSAGDFDLAGSAGFLDGQFCEGTAATVVNQNTVRAHFSTPCEQFNEYWVWAEVDAGGVEAKNNGFENAQMSLPTGGNVGAFANGFTTGPEAFSTTFNNSNGVVSIVLDQRFTNDSLFDINLVDETGNELPATPTNVSGAGGPAGPVVAQAQFTPGEVAGARSLLLDSCAFETAAGFCNVDQNLAPAAGTPKRQVKHGHVVRHHTSKRAWKHMKRAAKRHLKHIA